MVDMSVSWSFKFIVFKALLLHNAVELQTLSIKNYMSSQTKDISFLCIESRIPQKQIFEFFSKVLLRFTEKHNNED
jgi:hypothetical protein